LNELLFQALETESGGVRVYEMALRCVQNDDLRKEWEEYHEQTTHHVELVEDLLRSFGLDRGSETPGRAVVRHIGASLVKAMEMALTSGTPDAAELVAAECVTLAETKDHLNWDVIGKAEHVTGKKARPLGRPSAKSKSKKTNTSTVRPAGPGAVDRGARHALGPAATRRAKRCQDRHRSGASETSSRRNGLRAERLQAGDDREPMGHFLGTINGCNNDRRAVIASAFSAAI
jgi:hypothetical protein